MQRHRNLLVVLMISCLLATGCWDQDEITSLASVSGLGIDATDKPGIILVTMQIAAPTGSASGGGTSEGAKLRVISTEAETIQEGVTQLQTRLRRRPFLLHLNFVVFGERLARSGIDGMVTGLQGMSQVRGSVPVFVAAGDAVQVLQAHSGIARSPGQDVSDLLDNIASSPIGNATTLNDLVNTLTSLGKEPAIPILDLVPLDLMSGTDMPNDGTGQSGQRYQEVMMYRTAVFKRDRWVDTLDRFQTNTLVLLLGGSRQGVGSTPNPSNPDEPFAFQFERFSVAYRVNMDDQGVPRFLLDSKATIRLLEARGGYDLRQNGTKPLEQAIEFDMVLMARQLTEQLQATGVDSLGLGQKIAARNPSAWRQLEPIWSDVYPEVEVEIRAEASLRSTGLISKIFQTKR